MDARTTSARSRRADVPQLISGAYAELVRAAFLHIRGDNEVEDVEDLAPLTQ